MLRGRQSQDCIDGQNSAVAGAECNTVIELKPEHHFTEEQILDFLKQAEAGVPVKELCRLENSRLKKLLAEAHLDIESLKVVARGKG